MRVYQEKDLKAQQGPLFAGEWIIIVEDGNVSIKTEGNNGSFSTLM